ncbi:UDP-N-acetylmuramate--L-alanine ligase [Alphaproteobacteria bacterium]|nr:UDP-N-acetylmuramate--L-alanine ligase [Alphaproteobacteria bacterium]GHS98092.1 UDP-N-acetylmuramate--L-alanine ligase [Alphaproteobacteria bacterium]
MLESLPEAIRCFSPISVVEGFRIRFSPTKSPAFFAHSGYTLGEPLSLNFVRVSFFSFYSTRSLHFVGIGGIGMSGIAEILHNQGYAVRGSDASENANVRRLRALGIPITIRHDEKNIRGVQALVVSSAISETNSEVVAARHYGIPIITRGEMLAEIMRSQKSIAISGTHGKTTTTSLIASLLSEARLDPTVINGGILNTYQTNARLGTGEWIVAEADESDGSFLKLPSIIHVVTNIDPEHMSYYKTEENLENAFRQFVRNLPLYGLAVLCWDHPRVRKVFSQKVDRRFVTYGLEGAPHFKAQNIRPNAGGTLFDILITRDIPLMLSPSGPGITPSRVIEDIFIPMFGNHNILNALAALAVAFELNIAPEICRTGLKKFQGVKRRFTLLGNKEGRTFVDDYAHHPEEIRAVLQAARQTPAARVVAVFQPHRYSRLSHLFDAFVDVLKGMDGVIIMPIYAAGEAPLEGYTPEALAARLQEEGCKNVFCAKDAEDLAKILKKETKEGDCVLGLGAGSISDMMAKIYEEF